MLGLKLITETRDRDSKMIDTKQEEIWRIYPELPFIEASNLGRVRTKDRYVKVKGQGKRLIKGRILRQWDSGQGYLYVRFRLNGKKVNRYVHRIVAASFISNPLGLPQVNHKDNDPTNNAVGNLEWCTSQYNTAYREKYGKAAAEVCGRSVIAINIETSEVFWFKTQREAACQLEVNVGHLNEVVKGKLNKTSGYWFCYADETAVEKTRKKFGDKIANKVEELINQTL